MSIDWNVLSAIATAAAAIATACMAWMTRKSMLQVEKHHQNGFRPICILENNYGFDDPTRRDGYLSVKRYGNADLIISMQLKLKNVGSGPALHVRMILLFPDNSPESGYPVELPSLPSGGEYSASSEPIVFRMSMQNYEQHKFGFNLPINDTNNIPVSALWNIVLEYEDVFGNIFYTVHPKNASCPWTKIGVGSINLPAQVRKEIDRQNRLDPSCLISGALSVSNTERFPGKTAD